jgi:hypothetical protein
MRSLHQRQQASKKIKCTLNYERIREEAAQKQKQMDKLDRKRRRLRK